MWPMINDVETGGTPQYPDIQPQRVALDPHTTLEECEAVARTTVRWTVEQVDVQERRIVVVAKSRLLGFRDDITIRVEEDPGGGAVVQMRSKSRVGRGDLGQNARTIRAFQAALGDAVHARMQRREPGT